MTLSGLSLVLHNLPTWIRNIFIRIRGKEIALGSAFADELLAALDKIDRPGSFCTSGSAPLVLPGLEVRGVGEVGLPLSKSQAAELKRVCRQAPYGKGEQTLVDTDVRRVWQLDADRFKLTNPEWQNFLKATVSTIQTELGLEDQKLEPHLYNLLLYEKGNFFKSHRDGERLERMVATLVVVLPSAHEGGDLIVRHEGVEQVIPMGGSDNHFRVQFAAFYADCEHEIRPVVDGFRLCLVYNLALAKSKANAGILAPRSGAHIAEVAGILGRWPADNSVKKLAVLLDHQYTEPGLVFDALKGVDRVKAKVLFEAARQASCQAFLALMTLWQSGSAEPEFNDYDHYSRRRYYDDDDDDNGESDGGPQHTMGEVFDSSLSADHWSDAEGKLVPFGAIAIEPAEVVPQDVLTEVDPEEDFEGYTGNAGMTLERWYRHAAIVLWPEKAHFDVLCDAGNEAAFGGLQKMVADGKKAGKRRWLELRPQYVEFARSIIARWPKREYAPWGEAEVAEKNALLVFAAFEDAALISSFLRGPMLRDVALSSAGALRTIGKQHGWQALHDDLAAIFDATDTESILRNVAVLEELSSVKDTSHDRRALCRFLAGRMLPGLEAMDQKTTPDDWRSGRINRTMILSSLVKSLLNVDGSDVLLQYVDHVLGLPKRYPLTDVQVPALLGLESWLAKQDDVASPVVKKWLAACLAELHSRVNNPPQRPADWRRPASLSCKCSLCSELSQFLKNREEQVHRFSVRKELRKHLHRIIDNDGCDLDHQTDRRGSPQTLVCTKNYASYEKAVKANQIETSHLDQIVKMCKRLGVS